ncbi:hypothetical protein [Allosediminivita pacifica]|uniref:Uncharacterized protein n=1 Tax=Allosediminivita pacifica TaxID=1267769 RepID=A0A2T6B7T3_9RHOB|nr:hypothetical protein [Allosediminivita pacifica]PTX52082.1 hypothetical protein C8N44_102127 [Allosediminivita pacifica]GGA97295.1 hypothetical protein GCM10011324_04450 [Allosediminivita pacifica]
MKIYPRIDVALMALLGLVMIATVSIALADPQTFSSSFAAEDGPIEYGTAVFLFLGACVLVSRAVGGAGSRGLVFAALTGIYALLFFLAAGEEVSWGQRIFGLETPEALAQRNDQQELTFHNLVVGGVKLDEVIFGNLLSVVLLSYLIGLTLLWPRFAWVRRFSEALAIPVPRRHHMLATLGVSVIIVLLPVSRKWEVYEFAFATIALGIFLFPRNAAATDLELPSSG